MMKHLTAAVLGLAALYGSRPVLADYVVYTNRASFESAIKSEGTETFNELGSNAQVFGASGLGQANGLAMPLTITSSNNSITSASASTLSGFYPSYGTYLLGPLSTASTDGLTVTLPANKYTAAGADVADFASNSVVNFLVTTALGASFTSRIPVDASTPGSSLGFLGVLVNTPGDSVTSLTFSSPVGANQSVVVDNFSVGFAPQAVPEPAAITLLVVGSIAIGAGALRRRLGHRED